MKQFNIKLKLTNLVISLTIKMVTSSIGGVNYLDPINMRPLPPYPRGEDPCNPLYWYPRNVPEYCNYKKFPFPGKPPMPPLPMPLPVPGPLPAVPPAPAPYSYLPPPPAPYPVLPPPPAPYPVFPPLPYGVPISPTNPMLPIAPPVMRSPYTYAASGYPSAPSPTNPYPSDLPQIGMVPGLPGLVTRDGGINILPFSDAYADLIETHKTRMIRNRLQKLIHEYEDFPYLRGHRRHRKYYE